MDGKKSADTGVVKGGEDASSDHTDWAGAAIIMSDSSNEKPAVIDVPYPGADIAYRFSSKPSINRLMIASATPGRPFIFLIPASVEGQLTYSVKGQPAGLTFGPARGIISGLLQKAGTYNIELLNKGKKGSAKRGLTQWLPVGLQRTASSILTSTIAGKAAAMQTAVSSA